MDASSRGSAGGLVAGVEIVLSSCVHRACNPEWAPLEHRPIELGGLVARVAGIGPGVSKNLHRLGICFSGCGG